MSEQAHPLIRTNTCPPPTAPRSQNGLPNRSFTYHIQGMGHLIARRSLLRSLTSRVVPLVLLSLFTFAFMFTFMWFPHVFVLGLFHEPFPRSAAATMILTECAGVVSIVAEVFMTERQIVDVFDTVLLSETKRVRGLNRRVEVMIKSTRNFEMDENGDKRLGPHRLNPLQKNREALRMGVYFLLELPLCLVPAVGTPLFLCLQGYHLGPFCHYHYFQLLGWDKPTRKAFIKRNRFRYFLFGLVHVLIGLVPVLSIFFLFSSGTGAALWAVDYEKVLWKENGDPARDYSPETEAAQAGLSAVPKFELEMSEDSGRPEKVLLSWWRKHVW